MWLVVCLVAGVVDVLVLVCLVVRCVGRLCGVVAYVCGWLVCSGVAVSVLVGCVVLAGFV